MNALALCHLLCVTFSLSVMAYPKATGLLAIVNI